MPGIGGGDIYKVLARHLPRLPVVVVSRTPAPLVTRNPSAVPSGAIPVDACDSERLLSRLRAVMERAAELGPRPAAPTQAEPVDLVSLARAIRLKRGFSPCPVCGSSRAAAILYGSERTDQRGALAAGRVVYGGAKRSPGAPTCQCRDCDHRWTDQRAGTPSIG
jgi:hypothetical protein